MLGRLGKRNVLLDPDAQPGRLGGRYYEEESRRGRHLPGEAAAAGAVVSLAAGSVSSLLGIGGGMLKVPALNAWCGVPLRAAAATSAFMIGVTATVGAVLYYGRGEIVPWMASAAILGVMVGSRLGFRIGAAASARWLKLLLAVVLVIVSILMFAEGTMSAEAKRHRPWGGGRAARAVAGRDARSGDDRWRPSLLAIGAAAAAGRRRASPCPASAVARRPGRADGDAGGAGGDFGGRVRQPSATGPSWP